MTLVKSNQITKSTSEVPQYSCFAKMNFLLGEDKIDRGCSYYELYLFFLRVCMCVCARACVCMCMYMHVCVLHQLRNALIYVEHFI